MAWLPAPACGCTVGLVTFAFLPVVTAHLTPLLASWRCVVTGTSFTVVPAVCERCVNCAASSTGIFASAGTIPDKNAAAMITIRSFMPGFSP